MYCGKTRGDVDRARRHGTINGVYCTDILVDTGATQTLVRKDLVTDDDILDGEVAIRCAHGDTSSYPLAAVKIHIGGKDIITTAGVSSTLPASALLGWDVPELLDFIAEGQNVRNNADALAVMTRLRRRQQEEGREQKPVQQEVEAAPRPVELSPAPENTETYDPVFNFDDLLFPPAGAPRPMLTRAQKRESRLRYRLANEEPGCRVPEAPDVSPEELRQLQKDDDSLSHVRAIADGTPSAAAGEEFSYREGLLYRRYRPPGVEDEAQEIEQLVLPLQLRPAVLKLAHDIPLAGHLGRKKTADRIVSRFYWPGLYRDIQEWCKTCGPCQKSSTRGVKKAPLIPLPIMDEPFRRIAMDIVGPLPRSSSGKRYILVICDYATRYPEAVALRVGGAWCAAFAMREMSRVEIYY